MSGFHSWSLFAAWMTASAMLVAAPSTSNLEREKSWADQVVDMVVVGEPVWLTNRGHKFLGLYTPGAGNSKLAVILIHGRGVHPAWGFLDTLRADLAEAGFTTLSLQMPILAAETKFSAYGPTFPEAYERIDAGLQFLRHKNFQRVVLLGHSSGAMTALAYVAKNPQQPIAGIVAVGASTLASGEDVMQPAVMLKSLKRHVLDIYGANDLPEVLMYSEARAKAAAEAGNKFYKAVRVPHADHFFTDQYVPLKNQINSWLATLAPRQP